MKIIYLLFLFFVQFVFGQNYSITYKYTFVPDSTNVENKLQDILVLKTSAEKSEFFSLEKFQADSVRLSEKNNGTYEVKPSKKILITERIIKYPLGNIKQITSIGTQLFQIKDDRKINWEIQPEFATILNYKVQKATTVFGGRKWIAWFAPEIPIQDGPYKFRGLPGLILKVEDSQQYHIFMMSSFEKSTQSFVYPESETYDSLPELDYRQYRKKYLQFRADPVADLVGKIPDQPDQYGNMKSGAQILNEFRQKEIKRLKSDNNIIEIDLLKNQ